LSYGDKGGRASVSVPLTIKRSLRERSAHNSLENGSRD